MNAAALAQALAALMELPNVDSVEEYGTNFEIVESFLRAAIKAEAVQVEPVEQMTDAQIHKGLHKDFPESSENMRLAYFAGVRFAEGRAALEAVQVEPEPFGCVVNGTFYSLSQIRWLERHDEKYDKRTLVYTTPQPTVQAESVSAKPLTKKQILELIHAKHVHKDYVLHESDRACLDWYELGLRDGEAAHGIKKPS